MDDQRIEPWPLLCLEYSGNGLGIERIGRKPVNRLGRQRDDFASPEQINRPAGLRARNYLGFHIGSSAARTDSVCFRRKAWRLDRIFSSDVARIAAASKAAFLAPAEPIASVPTGIPPGICAIDSNESSPCNDCDCIGTPRTGNHV